MASALLHLVAIILFVGFSVLQFGESGTGSVAFEVTLVEAPPGGALQATPSAANQVPPPEPGLLGNQPTTSPAEPPPSHTSKPAEATDQSPSRESRPNALESEQKPPQETAQPRLPVADKADLAAAPSFRPSPSLHRSIIPRQTAEPLVKPPLNPNPQPLRTLTGGQFAAAEQTFRLPPPAPPSQPLLSQPLPPQAPPIQMPVRAAQSFTIPAQPIAVPVNAQSSGPVVDRATLPGAAKPGYGRDADLGNNYPEQIRSWLNQYRGSLDRLHGWRGTGAVKVKFNVSPEGVISAPEIAESSGIETLDLATLDLLELASPVPAPPERFRHDGVTMTLVLNYVAEH